MTLEYVSSCTLPVCTLPCLSLYLTYACKSLFPWVSLGISEDERLDLLVLIREYVVLATGFLLVVAGIQFSVGRPNISVNRL